jgi:hypothetical protein
MKALCLRFGGGPLNLAFGADFLRLPRGGTAWVRFFSATDRSGRSDAVGLDRYSPRMSLDLRMGLRRTALLTFASVAVSALAACGNGTTGGYPPEPPPYEPPAATIVKAKDPKFEPLIKALIAQRKAGKALADFKVNGKMDEAQQKKYTELFGKAMDLRTEMTKVIEAAQLVAEDKVTWSQISALDDARLEALLKP